MFIVQATNGAYYMKLYRAKFTLVFFKLDPLITFTNCFPSGNGLDYIQ